MITAKDLRAASGDVAKVLDIFNNNIILPTYVPSRNFAGYYPMGIKPGWSLSPYTGKNQLDQTVDVLSMTNDTAVPVNDCFFAYWCPYEQGNCLSAFLGNDADYMFTAKMDGCSFGIGSATAGGVQVAHANSGGKGAEQLEQLRGIAGFKNDSRMRYLGPAAYRYRATTHLGGTEATTFGIRVGAGNWKFFSQVLFINKDAKTMQIVEIKPLG